RERLACAALLYGYLLDLEGHTEVADASKKYYFAVPGLSMAEVPRDRPLLIARAGREETPGLAAAVQRLPGAPHGVPLTLIEHAEGPHAFDLSDDSPRTHEVVEEILDWLARTLA